MTNSIDRLINEVVFLRLEVERLRAQVVALQDQVGDGDGEVAALRIMLTTWPVQYPIPPSVVH